ncbi:Microcystin-dependent protein [Methylobacterium sp. ap11]|uniref:phage tail protein n=1 Tax=Methylobacterium sp. ap11 TaxID=1761799 RepID=UPI0008C87D39|nr:tail fiber protein [Methylobacterium sp. ap11]SEP08420.1 Microcystin-dependent protein [Methylobacterium sp. ap11]
MEAMTSMIFMVPFTWAPDGWLSCRGQILNIQQYQAVYSLIGTMYGGNATTTFGLPNLSGRTAIGAGQSTVTPGTQYAVSSVYGTETTTLAAANLPPHVHPATFAPTMGSQNITIPAQTGPLKVALNVSNAPGGGAPGTGTVLGSGTSTSKIYAAYPPTAPNAMTALNDASTTVTGTPAIPQQTVAINTVTGGTVTVGANSGGTPFSTMQPSLALNFIITMFGLYPQRPN